MSRFGGARKAHNAFSAALRKSSRRYSECCVVVDVVVVVWVDEDDTAVDVDVEVEVEVESEDVREITSNTPSHTSPLSARRQIAHCSRQIQHAVSH
jgi:hypothetical protein